MSAFTEFLRRSFKRPRPAPLRVEPEPEHPYVPFQDIYDLQNRLKFYPIPGAQSLTRNVPIRYIDRLLNAGLTADQVYALATVYFDIQDAKRPHHYR